MLWQILTSRRRRRWLYRDACGLQSSLLSSLLRRAQDTEVGRAWGFKDLLKESNVFQAYQRRVPLHQYPDFEAQIQRMRRGERDILWPGKIDWFAISGGTTAGKKLIPRSTDMMAGGLRFRADAAASYMSHPGRVGVYFRPGMGLSGNLVPDPDFPQNVVGEVSGLMLEHTWRGVPTFLRKRAAESLGSEAERHEIDLFKKMDYLIDRCLPRDIHWMVFSPSWGIILLRRAIARVNQQRSQPVSTIAEIWPNLKLIATAARPLANYRADLQAVIGDLAVDFQELYVASEGAYAYQDDLQDPSLLLHTASGVFYEFVPWSEYRQPGAARLTLENVVVGQPYVLYITTCAGLWAYETGDIVEFTQLNPPKLQVKGRAIEILNSVGEFLTGVQIRQALEMVCRNLECEIAEVHVSILAATSQRGHHHQWAIEWKRPPAHGENLLQCLDDALSTASPTYRGSRAVQRLGEPEILNVPTGTFQAMLQEQGTVSVQTKVRLASESREIMHRLVAAANQLSS